MIPKEIEPPMDLVVFEISEKTPIDRLETWSSQRWPSSGTKIVAEDIVNNAAELTMASDKEIDFELVLRNIKVYRHGSGVYSGRRAIAVHSARTIGGIAVALGLSMHDPPLVVLSGIYFSESESVKNNSSLNDFRKIMIEVTEGYARDTLPSPDLYMKILRSLFIEKTQNTKRRTGQLLQTGNIEEVYNMINPRGAFVMSRTRQFPKATTSSILTPPNPSI
mgnify:FL=1